MGDQLTGSSQLKWIVWTVNVSNSFSVHFSLNETWENQLLKIGDSSSSKFHTCKLFSLYFIIRPTKPNFPHALSLFSFQIPNWRSIPHPIAHTHLARGSGSIWIPCCIYPMCIMCTVQASYTRRLLKKTYEKKTTGFPAFIKHATRRLFSSVCLFKNAPQAAPVASSHLKIRSGHISSLQPAGFDLFICMSLYIKITGSCKTTEGASVNQAGDKEQKQMVFWRKSEEREEDRRQTMAWLKNKWL